jgi:hypothetical protein
MSASEIGVDQRTVGHDPPAALWAVEQLELSGPDLIYDLRDAIAVETGAD